MDTEGSVDVLPVNDAPTADDDEAETDEDVPVVVDVLGNDSDVDSPLDPASVAVTLAPASGAAVPVGDGTVTYTPSADFFGSDAFGYEVCDVEGLCHTATVTVDVFPVNDGPTADDDEAETDEDVPVVVDVLGNDSDADSALDPSSVVPASLASNGTVDIVGDGTLLYTPSPDFFGSDAFGYEVCDVEGLCDGATVSVDVLPVNDPPTAADDEAATDEDTPVVVDVLGNDGDIDSPLDPGSVFVAVAPGTGTADAAGDGTVVYTPALDFFGSDTFGYEVCDVFGLCDAATVTVDVLPVNDPPTAVDDEAFTDEDIPVVIDVLANDDDIDSALDATSLVITTGPGFGSADPVGDGTALYTSEPDFSGSDTFGYEVCDAEGLCDDAFVTVEVVAVNDPPTAADDTASTDEDTPVLVDVLGNDDDIDGPLDPSSVAVVSPAAFGIAEVLGGGTVRYTPDPDFFGQDLFGYMVCDNEGLCDQATVAVDVKAVIDPPIAIDDEVTVVIDPGAGGLARAEAAIVAVAGSAVIDVLANDFDPDGDPIEIVKFDEVTSAKGTVKCQVTCEYKPPGGFFGIDTFAYTIGDPSGLTSTAKVIITVEIVVAAEYLGSIPDGGGAQVAAVGEQAEVAVELLADQKAVPVLPLTANPVPGNEELPNYDIERDAEPGLFLETSPGNEDEQFKETDLARYQMWAKPVEGNFTLVGRGEFTIWGRAATPKEPLPVQIRVFLLDCEKPSNTGIECREIARGDLQTKSWGAVPGEWAPGTIDIATLDYIVQSGHMFVIKLVVSGPRSGTDMHFGFDALGFESSFMVLGSPEVDDEAGKGG